MSKKLDLASAIAANISDEATAKSGYYTLISEYDDVLEEADIERIKTIISDETEHEIDLLALMMKYGNTGSGSDGVPEAVDYILDRLQ